MSEELKEQIYQETISELQHVSALLWEPLLGKPFELPKELMKRRGRPRKHVQFIDGKNNHKLGDVEPNDRQLLSMTVHKIMLDYKEYVLEGLSPKQALEEICKLYRVPYGQAFNIVVDEM